MKLKFIDLSHEIHSKVPTWEGKCGFQNKIVMDYKKDVFRAMEYEMFASCGTHMDAPAHIVPGAKDVSKIEIQDLFHPVFILDVQSKVEKDPGYKISVEDILFYESQYGQILQNGFLVGLTGWSVHWDKPEKYRNVVKDTMVFPTFSSDAADFLLKRGISGLGIDTLSPDTPDTDFPVHRKVLGSGKVILENLTNLSKLPPKGAYLLALPLKIKDGTESPIRAVGII